MPTKYRLSKHSIRLHMFESSQFSHLIDSRFLNLKCAWTFSKRDTQYWSKSHNISSMRGFKGLYCTDDHQKNLTSPIIWILCRMCLQFLFNLAVFRDLCVLGIVSPLSVLYVRLDFSSRFWIVFAFGAIIHPGGSASLLLGMLLSAQRVTLRCSRTNRILEASLILCKPCEWSDLCVFMTFDTWSVVMEPHLNSITTTGGHISTGTVVKFEARNFPLVERIWRHIRRQ